ncbi:cyclic nucleotide-binding/CBS domain-containing protein [Blastococcus sp. URHD0036]|uniref:CBS domain-containing protein n=1 Tax=Blastococcus sp. URHD0036 TaxID=1380356 RepID=UPI0004982451|nr:CBS domain-containing protein [Blastococcus sp. URHD0036]
MSPRGASGQAPSTDTVRSPTVGDVMRPAATTVETRAHLAAAAYLMKRTGDSALVVTTDDDRRAPLGVVTDGDISQAVADGRDLEQVRIGELLTRTTYDVPPGTPVVEALRVMADRRLHHLLVVTEGGLTGIVDMIDLCRAQLDDDQAWGASRTADG